MNNFDLIKNVIKEENKILNLFDKFMDLSENSYILIQWPESQMFMEKEWFTEEAILEVEGKFGNSAYFIPLKRIL